MEQLAVSRRGGTRRLLIVLFTLALYFLITALPCREGLSQQGLRSIALMVCALIFWILDVLPIGVTALLFTVLQPIAGTVTPAAMAANFLPTTFFFSIACFLISQALLDTGLGNRVVTLLLRVSGGSPKRLLFLLMCALSLISFLIANLALVALMIPLLTRIFEENRLRPGESNFAKACLIGVPVASSIGGCATPAGALPNYQAIALAQEVAGETITFGQWTMLGAPLAILLTPLAYLVIVLVFPPEIDTLDRRSLEGLRDAGPVTPREWAFIVIFAALVLSWFVTDIPMPISAMLAVSLFFLPGIGILNGEGFRKAIDWNIMLLVCGSTGLAMAIFQTGAAAWIANAVMGPFAGASPLVLAAVIIAFTVFAHILIPVNPSMVAVFVPVVALLASGLGLRASTLILPMAYAVNCAFILPLDSVFAITYAPGYYSMKDLAKVGVPLSLLWIAVGTLLTLPVL